MKIFDIISKQSIYTPNQSDIGAIEMKYPNVYDKKNIDMGSRTKISKQKVIVRDSKTGKVWGMRTIYQK